MQSSVKDPRKYNEVLTDEIMRECACKAAQFAIHLIDEAKENRQVAAFDEHLSALGDLIHGCAAAMVEGKEKGPEFDFDND